MPEAGRRHCFLVETGPGADVLVRVLTPFAVQGADLAEVTLLQSPDGGLSIRIESEGLDEVRAETLLRRVQGLPIVRRVGLGWRGLAQAAA